MRTLDVSLRLPVRHPTVSEAGATRIQAITAIAVLAAPAAWTVLPYLMAGGGGYAEMGKGWRRAGASALG
jgi:hypothetical protein